MKKVLIMLGILIAAAGMCFAAAEKESAESDVPHVVLIVKDLTNPFFVDMKVGGQAAADAYGVEYTCLAPEKYSVENQIRIMEDLVEQKVDGIVIVPIDGKGIVSGIERANEADIPVMNCNTLAAGGDIIGFAGIDHVSMGVAMGEYFAEKLNGEGKIVIIEGTSGASTSIDRIVGIHSVIDDYPGIEVLASTTAQYNRQQGMQVMEDLLTRFPVIDAALCVNDAMALGAKEAVLDARRDVMIGGIDAIPEALAAIESGEMECTVDSNGYGQAYVAVELLIKYLLEGEMPPEETKIGTGEAYAISADNLAEFKAMKESR